MQSDWFSVGLTVVGMAAGVAGTVFAGYFKAKREGFDKFTLAQMAQAKEFYADVMIEVQNLRNENVELRRAVQALEQKNAIHGWDKSEDEE